MGEHAILNTFLRNAEYYNMQYIFDQLFADSKKGKSFNRLYDLILSRENILLAYRTIKTNVGSKTSGIDKVTIEDFKTLESNEIVNLVREAVTNYKPNTVRRVFIPKANGKMRPLGIPTMRDRLIQQCFKQVLEPILEAKFYKHSYGFRPLRNTRHAMARIQYLINHSKLHYVIDIDIESFFDNVNHKMLMKQLWNLGIRDLRVRAIIKKMLKAPIQGEGVPKKGTPQGGILSPLLANVVLNDLDQWVASQWENFKTRHPYAKLGKYQAMKRTKLKEGYIVRYADDFKILARDWKSAWRWYHAVKDYLKVRLKLDISREKSKVINLRKRKSEFLGFEIKAISKRKTVVAKTFVSKKSKERIIGKIMSQIQKIKRSPSHPTVRQLNSIILGLHNYFRYATMVI